MKIYTVYVNNKEKNPLETAIFIEEGVSWIAGIFQTFWALYKKMWFWALIFLAVNLTVGYIDMNAIFPSKMVTIINIGLILLIAFNANDLYRMSLRNKGFVFLDVVSGKNLVEAQQRFFNEYISDLTVKIDSEEEIKST